ncbi:MAG: GAF domain-containing protein [Desulfobacterales bacterium]
MSSNLLSSLDMTELVKGLPPLICETNIENQVANIQKWLEPVMPVNGIGLSLTGSDQNDGNMVGINIQENVMQEVEKRFAENEDGSGAQKTDGLFLFALHGGTPVISSLPQLNESGLSSDVNGLAIRLKYNGGAFGTLFLVTDTDVVVRFSSDETRLQWFSSVCSNLFYNSRIHHQNQENERLFKLYESVSSSLCYAGDLQELLTMIISIIVSELPSEEGSILLFNDETNELEFFSAIGDTGAGLVQCRFPADKGIAGKALQDGAPVIVNDVQTCPYFFGNIDDESGFVTKSILAAPVIAGGEKVGVIEAINKIGETGFSEADKRVLMAIADEVGLAVKNARMFEYVVNSYCKIRQGLMSCKGCVRPLRSWTPCARQLDGV